MRVMPMHITVLVKQESTGRSQLHLEEFHHFSIQEYCCFGYAASA